jgi:hypothetical protein
MTNKDYMNNKFVWNLINDESNVETWSLNTLLVRGL